jgi:hypothetical protein
MLHTPIKLTAATCLSSGSTIQNFWSNSTLIFTLNPIDTWQAVWPQLFTTLLFMQENPKQKKNPGQKSEKQT